MQSLLYWRLLASSALSLLDQLLAFSFRDNDAPGSARYSVHINFRAFTVFGEDKLEFGHCGAPVMGVYGAS
jgi:hypothetical protein